MRFKELVFGKSITFFIIPESSNPERNNTIKSIVNSSWNEKSTQNATFKNQFNNSWLFSTGKNCRALFNRVLRWCFVFSLNLRLIDAFRGIIKINAWRRGTKKNLWRHHGQERIRKSSFSSQLVEHIKIYWLLLVQMRSECWKLQKIYKTLVVVVVVVVGEVRVSLEYF